MTTRVKWDWTVPNVISLVRIFLVPLFVWLYIKGMPEGQEVWQYWSFGVLALSGLTDCVDGYIARRFNQISEMGKILDPIADKLTQMAVLICVAWNYTELIPLMVVCICKEIGQAIGSVLMLKKGAKVQAAKWYGKITTIVFYMVMAAFVLWPNMPLYLTVPLGVVVAGLMIFTFVQYTLLYIKNSKALEQASTSEKE